MSDATPSPELYEQKIERFREAVEQRNLLPFLESVREGLPCSSGMCRDTSLRDCCC
ncbi:hypothetical protein BMS3Abin16_00731 [archaeon BMS3Abin16]|nr:hypothetical protein BMS3Abin16_00731 [archaeon BMS3Abin16]GBE55860.1 hypothetical protein BMS3Bbin16_00055 [archaeon BMS3Bbin16]